MHDLITKVIASKEMQEIATWLLIFVILYLSGRAILELIFWKPHRPELISSIDIAAALRNKKCSCGIFVTCAKHSLELDNLDQQLEREGE